ncbi:prepilin-type N-terminal cleavage/methylation domain-containing protein [bacterium]|jgi:prepilin-type N-terminal cleavage/methylation domain-containing protein|nr:prepilin-type N-terminal cleavage/methylation domain-containing protein [bacterium]
MSKLNKNNNFGFTLIELILVIVFIGVLAGLSAPIYNRFQNSNSVELASMELVQSLRRAQVLSRSSDGDSNWGVYIASGQITLFKGISYAARDLAYDENYTIAEVIIVSGLQEIVFDKFSGDPQSTGSTIFTINVNANKTITINAKGVLTY